MNGWLIYDQRIAERNASYIDWFIKEAALQQISLQLKYREHLSISIDGCNYYVRENDKSVPLPDFVKVRVVEPVLQTFFELCGVKTFNSAKAALICNHKALTHLEVQKLRIPMVETYFYRSEALPITPPLSYPFIVKEATGRGGKQVSFIENGSVWKNVRHNVKAKDLLLQSADVQLGKDVRVFIIGKEIIGASLRENKGDFRANISLGGRATPYKLSPQEREMVELIVNHFNFGLVGIDFLIDHHGNLLFNEIEDVVGSRTLSKTSDINLLRKYVAYIKQAVLHNQQSLLSQTTK